MSGILLLFHNNLPKLNYDIDFHSSVINFLHRLNLCCKQKFQVIASLLSNTLKCKITLECNYSVVLINFKKFMIFLTQILN